MRFVPILAALIGLSISATIKFEDDDLCATGNYYKFNFIFLNFTVLKFKQEKRYDSGVESSD